jgi:hypothetical protein
VNITVSNEINDLKILMIAVTIYDQKCRMHVKLKLSLCFNWAPRHGRAEV